MNLNSVDQSGRSLQPDTASESSADTYEQTLRIQRQTQMPKEKASLRSALKSGSTSAPVASKNVTFGKPLYMFTAMSEECWLD